MGGVHIPIIVISVVMSSTLASLMQGPHGQSTLFGWKKSSFKSTVRYDPANFAPGTIEALSFLMYNLNYKATCPSYTISTLMDCAAESHAEAGKAIKCWLLGGRNRSEDIRTEGILGSDVSQYFLTPDKRVDVAWYFTINEFIEIAVQIEVMSNSQREATLLKLGFGLMDQLRAQRNRLDTIFSVVGFYFPLGSGHVEEVTCTWSDDAMRFFLTGVKLRQGEVKQRIQAVADDQKAKISAIRGNENKHHTIPLTHEYVTRTFGDGAYQLWSGQSYVIVLGNCVYKHPFGLREFVQLQVLSGLALNLQHNAIPKAPTVFNKFFFFEFEKFIQPLSPTRALTVIKDLAHSVKEAITEFHNVTSNAHLDIRLENVCFRNDGRAVLIDFDRSMPIDTEARYLKSLWGTSAMYLAEPGWTVDKSDWRQLGIMLLSLLKSTDEHSLPECFPHVFLETLYRRGQC